MVSHAKFALTLGLLLSAMVVGVSACREAEQDRVLYHEKGVYPGPPQAQISEETLADLRIRAAQQKY